MKQNNDKICPVVEKWDKDWYDNNWTKDDEWKPYPLNPKKFRCLDPSHNPPTHLYIPPGEEHIHKCPSCGMEVVMRGRDIYW